MAQQIPAKGEQNCRWYILKLITKRWTPTGDIDRTERLAGILGGQEAIDKYQERYKKREPYDIVIMDLTIPGGMGGEETIKALLKIEELSSIA